MLPIWKAKIKSMHIRQASNCHSNIFHGDTSFIMTLEMAVWRLQYNLSNSLNMQRWAVLRSSHPHLPLSPRSYEYFHTKWQYTAQHWTGNLVIKSILHLTEPIEKLINLKEHRCPPPIRPSGYIWTSGCDIGSTTVTAATIPNKKYSVVVGDQIKCFEDLTQQYEGITCEDSIRNRRDEHE